MTFIDPKDLTRPTELDDLSVIERLDRLERMVTGDKIKLDDIPIAELQRRLEQQWQADAGTLLQPGSITPELLSNAIRFGPSPGFNWSGGNQTNVVVTHGLGRLPIQVICGNARYGDAIGGDARAPWVTVAGAYTATTFTIVFRTLNAAVIGVFGVPAGACDWVAF